MTTNTVTLTAPDISCEHCKATIEREVNAMPGVESVQVDIPTQQVQVVFQPDQTSRTALIAKLDDEGYPVREA